MCNIATILSLYEVMTEVLIGWCNMLCTDVADY